MDSNDIFIIIMNTLSGDILIEIIKFINSTSGQPNNDNHEIFRIIISMLTLSKIINKKLINYVYVYGSKIRHEFFDQKLLIADSFKWIDESPNFNQIINYVRSDDNLCIAGGYTTLMFFNKNLNNFPDSDVDIFIMNVSADPVETFKKLHQFIIQTYPDAKYNQIISVFDIKIESINRTIQIILTDLRSPVHVLSSFDFSHNKSCYYLGRTYCLPDAQQSLSLKKTYYYAKQIRIQRLIKVNKLGLTISNVKIDEGLNTVKKSPIEYKLFSSLFDNDDCEEIKLIPATFNNFANKYGDDYHNIFELDKSKILKNSQHLHLLNLNETNLDLNKINVEYVTSEKFIVENIATINRTVNIIYDNKIIIPFISLKCTMHNYNLTCKILVQYNDIKQLIMLDECLNNTSSKLFSENNSISTFMSNIGIGIFSNKVGTNWIYLTKDKNLLINNGPCTIKIIPVFTYYETNHVDSCSKSHYGLTTNYYIHDIVY